MRKVIPFGFLVAALLVSPAWSDPNPRPCPQVHGCVDFCLDQDLERADSHLCTPDYDNVLEEDFGWNVCKKPDNSIFSCPEGFTIVTLTAPCFCDHCNNDAGGYCCFCLNCPTDPAQALDHKVWLDCRQVVGGGE